jgi:hypothetical protein
MLGRVVLVGGGNVELVDLDEQVVVHAFADDRWGDGAMEPRLERVLLPGGRVGRDDHDAAVVGAHGHGAELAGVGRGKEPRDLAVETDFVARQERETVLRCERARDVVLADETLADEELAETLATLHRGDEGALEHVLLQEALPVEDRPERETAQVLRPVFRHLVLRRRRREAEGRLGSRHEAQPGAERRGRRLGVLGRDGLRRREGRR